MKKCWDEKFEKRPEFSHLVHTMGNMLTDSYKKVPGVDVGLKATQAGSLLVDCLNIKRTKTTFVTQDFVN